MLDESLSGADLPIIFEPRAESQKKIVWRIIFSMHEIWQNKWMKQICMFWESLSKSRPEYCEESVSEKSSILNAAKIEKNMTQNVWKSCFVENFGQNLVRILSVCCPIWFFPRCWWNSFPRFCENISLWFNEIMLCSLLAMTFVQISFIKHLKNSYGRKIAVVILTRST